MYQFLFLASFLVIGFASVALSGDRKKKTYRYLGAKKRYLNRWKSDNYRESDEENKQRNNKKNRQWNNKKNKQRRLRAITLQGEIEKS